MGGAVALLCTLRLLRALTASDVRPLVHCICFGTPAVGNAALATFVDAAGWSTHFTSFVLPGWSMCLLFLSIALHMHVLERLCRIMLVQRTWCLA